MNWTAVTWTMLYQLSPNERSLESISLGLAVSIIIFSVPVFAKGLTWTIWAVYHGIALISRPHNPAERPVKPYRFIILTEWNVEPFIVEVNNIKAAQPTCLVASDSCCSILSTTFLKGGLLKGSGSQQDLIIWYLHSSIQTHKHLYLSTVITHPFLFSGCVLLF